MREVERTIALVSDKTADDVSDGALAAALGANNEEDFF